MILTAIFLLGAGLLAMVWLQDRTAQRMAQERKDWQLERSSLLQRIQAPQVAVATHAAEQVEETRTAVPMTDEQIAEREQALAQIQEFERRLL